jgi:hypothetical protein
MVTLPEAVKSDVGTVAEMEVLDGVPTIVSGVTVDPLVQFTIGVVPVTAKFVPVTVRVKAAWPTTAEVGLIELRTGAVLIVKVCVPVPFVTPTRAVPAAASRLVVTVPMS